ncbi:MAG: cupin domain-containing protein [Alphaproteobacteria bacterium]
MTAPNQPRFFVNPDDVAAYTPANHAGTFNKRLIGPETVGARNIEVVLGQAVKSGGALPHAHPDLEQVVYVLAGKLRGELGGQTHDLGPGECAFIPPGLAHAFYVVSEEPMRALVIYSPPYVEDPKKGLARDKA